MPIVTHDFFRVGEVANRIGIMREGQLVSIIDAAHLLAQELEA